MPPRPAPSRIAQALDYLGRLRNQAAEFGGGVVSNLADRARAAGGLAYEALTTDPNIGRMTTAEFSQAAADRAPTPRLDQAARDIGTIGRAIVTQPVETGKAIVRGEVERAQQAMTSPQAAGQYAGSLIDPTRLAAALRHRIPISELDVYHGTPHKYAPTEANPLGEFDASKIGTGEGAQAYGHGIYLAERPELAEFYRKALTPPTDINDWSAGSLQIKKRGDYLDYSPKSNSAMDEARAILTENLLIDENTIRNAFDEGGIEKARAVMLGVADHTAEVRPDLKPYLGVLRKNLNEKLVFNATKNQGAILKADLPDEMIDRMLDWDKPLSEQSAAVREALMPIVKAAMKKRGTPDRALEYSANRAIGGDIVKDLLVGNGVTRADVSRIMQEAGIPGIRYLDAGSRGQGGSGTRNFVVFPGEEKKVRILERNGQPAPERIAQALEAAPNYRMAHRPMTVEGGAARLDNAYEAFGEDIYGPNALRYFGGSDPREAGTVAALKRLRDNPEAEVTIYRGVPADAKGGITKGDWVTLDRSAAQEYAELKPGQKGKVLAMKVKAKDVTTWPDSLLEFGYYPAE